MTSRFHFTLRSIKFLIWHVPLRPYTTNTDPVQTTKTSVHGAINMLGLAKRYEQKFFRPQPRKCTAIRSVQTEDYRGNVNPLGPDPGPAERWPASAQVGVSTYFASQSLWLLWKTPSALIPSTMMMTGAISRHSRQSYRAI